MRKTKEKRIIAKDTNKYPVEIEWYGYKIIKKTKNSNWLVIRPDGTCMNLCDSYAIPDRWSG